MPGLQRLAEACIRRFTQHHLLTIIRFNCIHADCVSAMYTIHAHTTDRLWKKTEQAPPKPPTVDEDGVEVEVEEGEVELVPPKYVHIENVIREPAMKYYGIPKLGAYLAVPVTYSTWLHPDGVSLVTVETEPAADGDGGEEDNDEDAKKAAVVVTTTSTTTTSDAAAASPYTKKTIPAELALCLDTMGQGRKFTKDDIALVQEWAARMSTALERIEHTLYESEVQLVPLCTSTEGAAQLTALQGEASTAAVETAVAALGEAASATEKATVEAATRYSLATACVNTHAAVLAAVSKRTLTPVPEALTSLNTSLALLGLKTPTTVTDGLTIIDPLIDAWRCDTAVSNRDQLVPSLLNALNRTLAAVIAYMYDMPELRANSCAKWLMPFGCCCNSTSL
eukprot:9917-Heterococcus_DN1.PRE.3